MEKKVTASVIFLLIILVTVVFSENVTSNGAGLSPSQQKNVSVTVIGPPVLIINSPTNGTYFINESLMLSVTHNADNLWYNLDKGNNISFGGIIDFNASEGSHTIFIFANNSYGITAKNVTFYIDLDLYNVIYDEFKSSSKGESTNFNEFSYEEIQNLENVILEHTSYGKISFNEAINVTDDGTPNSVTDIDSFVDISFNHIELNPSGLPNFNVNATLMLYGLSFTNPRILKDGVVCPLTICAIESYNGTLKFNVTGFSVYSAEETPEESPGGNGNGGGGGGGGEGLTITPKKEDIIVVPESLNVNVVEGVAKEQELAIINNRNKEISLTLDATDELKRVISFEKESLQIPAGGEERIKLMFLVEDGKIVLGEILLVEDSNIVKKIPVVVNVRSSNFLFDVSILIPEEYKKLTSGEKIISYISLVQLGEVEKVDVVASYTIKDFSGDVFLEESETFFVLAEKNFTKEFNSDNLPIGKYVLSLVVIYPGEFGVSSVQFEIVEKEGFSLNILMIIIFVVVVFVIIAINWLKRKGRGRKSKRK